MYRITIKKNLNKEINKKAPLETCISISVQTFIFNVECTLKQNELQNRVKQVNTIKNSVHDKIKKKDVLNVKTIDFWIFEYYTILLQMYGDQNDLNKFLA